MRDRNLGRAGNRRAACLPSQDLFLSVGWLGRGCSATPVDGGPMSASLRVLLPIVCIYLPAGHASAQRSPSEAPRIPATTYTIVMETQQSESGEGQVVYVDNRSSQDIIVTSVSLLECENIRESCHPMPLKIRIAAGDKRIVLRVHPRSDDRGYSYRSSFAWELVHDAPGEVARAEPVAPAPPPGVILVPRPGSPA